MPRHVRLFDEKGCRQAMAKLYDELTVLIEKANARTRAKRALRAKKAKAGTGSK